MKWRNLILLALLLPVFNSCVKKTDNFPNSTRQEFIIQARKFFNTSTEDRSHIAVDYKSQSPRLVLWDQANTFKVSGGYALIAPIEYLAPFFVRAEFCENKVFHLGASFS